MTRCREGSGTPKRTAGTEPDPLQDLQPVELVERRWHVIRFSRRKDESRSGIQD